jgi:hypothetical protein
MQSVQKRTVRDFHMDLGSKVGNPHLIHSS